MKAVEIQLLEQLAQEYGIFEKMGKRRVAQDVLENSMWANMINGALKALETIAIMSLDWKLTAIVKLLQSWLKDQREKQEQKKQESEWGAGYHSDTYNQGGSPYDQSYGGGTYY
jgi:hypothetical protein